jgi:hypothetical protein
MADMGSGQTQDLNTGPDIVKCTARFQGRQGEDSAWIGTCFKILACHTGGAPFSHSHRVPQGNGLSTVCARVCAVCAGPVILKSTL